MYYIILNILFVYSVPHGFGANVRWVSTRKSSKEVQVNIEPKKAFLGLADGKSRMPCACTCLVFRDNDFQMGILNTSSDVSTPSAEEKQ
jgi:hypothetical protein